MMDTLIIAICSVAGICGCIGGLIYMGFFSNNCSRKKCYWYAKQFENNCVLPGVMPTDCLETKGKEHFLKDDILRRRDERVEGC